MKRFIKSGIGKIIILGNLTMLILLLVTCGGGGGSSPGISPTNSNLITITGSFGGGKSPLSKLLDNFLPAKAFALTPGQVAKVIVFGPGKSVISDQGWGISLQWKIVNINADGTFSIEVARDVPVGIIFVGSANEYLGYLSLMNGITSIPINLLSTIIIPTVSISGVFEVGEQVNGSISGLNAIFCGGSDTITTIRTLTGREENWVIGEKITGSTSGAIAEVTAVSYVSPTSFTIDLGTLSSSGSIVEPSRDPLISEVIMTETELQSLAQISGMFSSIVKNPDVDGNGVIDFLEGKNYVMQLTYIFTAGSFGNNLVPSEGSFGLSNTFLSFCPPLSYQPESATIIGPAGSPFETPTLLIKSLGDPSTNRYNYVTSLQALLTGGTYIVQGASGANLTYYIPDQSSVMSDVIVIIPTITLNEDRTIKKISWTYKMADGNEPVEPSSFISVISINISSKVPVYDCGSNQNCCSTCFPTIFADSSVQEIDLSSKTINWDTLLKLNIGYTDIYFNANTFSYDR